MKTFHKQGARVEVLSDLAGVSARAAALFMKSAHECIEARGAFTVALSGGSTPKSLYQLLAGEDHRARVPWSQTHVFWSDERCVPPDDPQSNYRMAYETLLAHVPITGQQIHRMRGEDEPSRAAADYESVLRQQLDSADPRLCLVLLGMGEDGHTASLFPSSPALDDQDHLVAAPYVEKLGSYRLTLTLPMLNAALKIIFLVSGEAKAATLRAVFEENPDPRQWPPARRVRPRADGELVWLVDEAAAQLLKR
jgi:6-phosphogluconolactonase